MIAVNKILCGLGWATRMFLYFILALTILADMAYCWWKGIKNDE